MKYLSIVLELLPKDVIAIYILKQTKKLVSKTENLVDDGLYETLVNVLIKIGFISEKQAIDQEL